LLISRHATSGRLHAGPTLKHQLLAGSRRAQPPVDIETYGGGSGFYPYDPGPDQAGAVGRYFNIGASYDF
jgi:iron complex outermembrane receptor protein